MQRSNILSPYPQGVWKTVDKNNTSLEDLFVCKSVVVYH